MALRMSGTTDMATLSVLYRTILRNNTPMSLTVALKVCSRIISQAAPNPKSVESVREFVYYLRRVRDSCNEARIPMTKCYQSLSHRLAYFYVSTCNERGWDDAPSSIKKSYSHYVQTVQPKDDTYTGSNDVEDLPPRKPETIIRPNASKVVQRLPVKPNRLARCENWPNITQAFWPTRMDGYEELKLKHGPPSTWYASSERPAPPASALPTPSYYANRMNDSHSSPTEWLPEKKTSKDGGDSSFLDNKNPRSDDESSSSGVFDNAPSSAT
jgi:hypothetical protein